MIKLGAVYCIYDVSTFIEESIYRIYYSMDKILFILNTRPWCGNPVEGEPFNTYKKIFSMSDPDHKFELLSGTWETEAIQRNVGLRLLRNREVDWCLIVDDDELYNPSELKSVKNMLNTAEHAAYLIYHQIYWKSRDTIIDGVFGSFPTFVRTDGVVNFNQDRMIRVTNPHTWFSISANNIMCHHMSYVRSDREMLSKVQNFSHAHDVISDWYEEKWLKWDINTIDLHPTVGERFKRVIPVSDSKFQLESV